MAQLAIKGHETRGKEVIEILEMLGGNNLHEYVANCDCFGFYIGEGTKNIYYDWVGNCYDDEGVIVFTLEEFLENFPYKIGDKVKAARINDFIGRIINVLWDDNENQIIYVVEWDDITKSTLTYFAKGLQPYKEETRDNAVFDVNAQCCDIMNHLIKKETIEGKITMNEDKGTLVAIDLTLEIKKANEIEVILGDYEFVLKDGKTYFVKKNNYPKTYEECCEVLFPSSIELGKVLTSGYNCEKLKKFGELLICRDAYWKIAGEQMGLSKSWEPDYTDDNVKYIIGVHRNHSDLNCTIERNYILIFPTEEMRDAFYEYFKDLIESCKELL